MDTITIQLYRYNPETDSAPYVQDMEVHSGCFRNRMVLDVLEHLKTVDPTLPSAALAVRVFAAPMV